MPGQAFARGGQPDHQGGAGVVVGLPGQRGEAVRAGLQERVDLVMLRLHGLQGGLPLRIDPVHQ
jgi:hypothetical protein